MKRYLLTLLIGIVALLALAAALNIAVDPYGWYGSKRIARFNAIKPRIAEHVRLAKPAEIARAHPKTVVLGNSRAEIGFDPESKVWPSAMRPVYNLSIPGSGLSEQVPNFEAQLARGGVTTLIVGVDFVDFPVARDAAPPAREADPSPWGWLHNIMQTTFSIDATLDSLATVLGQKPGAETRTDHGFSPAAQMPPIVALEGHATMFRQADMERAAHLKRLPHNLFLTGGGSPDFDMLDRLIKDCAARDVRLILFVHPYHAYILQQFDQFGLMPLYETWKRDLAARVQAAAVQFPHAPAPVIWDFGFYNPVTTEDVPPKAGAPMTWYWEAGHYKAALGDRMIAQMLDGEDSDIGYRMTPDKLDAMLAAQPAAAQAYRAAHPGMAAYLEKMR